MNFCHEILIFVYFVFSAIVNVGHNLNIFQDKFDDYEVHYGHFSEARRLEMREHAREMFHFGYDNYIKYAFPKDELDPIHCTGRGPDHLNPSNININDVLGDYALTLVDTLDTLAIMGNATEFKKAIQLVVDNVSFDKNSTIQVFEATIRVMGGLLSAHLIITDPHQPFGDMSPSDYDGELLSLAHDLATRLMPAFEETATGIPHPRVNLQRGVLSDSINETCTAGAGTLMLEFGILSRLLRDPVYESISRRAVERLWAFRSNVTGLFGNVIDIQTGRWTGIMSGLGAGIDSFFEYLLKAFILFGDESYLSKFTESYETIKYYMRRGRKDCNNGSGFHPIYVNVNMRNGEVVNNWVDALQASWAGVQVLVGDVEEAICTHAFYYALWQRYDSLPERYNWHLKMPEVMFYPLRPELVESTYLLYQATQNPFYLHVGSKILISLENHTRAECGYATIHDVNKKNLEDRMESFFLSETCKYLFLLFDTENHVNKKATRYLFSTEGHLFPLNPELRRKPWEVFDLPTDRNSPSPSNSYGGWSSKSKDKDKSKGTRLNHPDNRAPSDDSKSPPGAGEWKASAGQADSKGTTYGRRMTFSDIDTNVIVDSHISNITHNCDKVSDERKYFLPIKSRYLQQIESLVGLQTLGKFG